MKQCPMCGSEHLDDAASCDCGYGFAGMGQSATASRAAPAPDRPDGGIVMGFGWGSLALSLLLGLFAMSQGPSAAEEILYGGPSSTDLARAALLSSASWVFFYLFLVLWPTGYIVRAISHLYPKVH